LREIYYALTPEGKKETISTFNFEKLIDYSFFYEELGIQKADLALAF
jgi:hypothetical protein